MHKPQSNRREVADIPASPEPAAALYAPAGRNAITASAAATMMTP